ncbi:hypothetical protein D6810_00855 [Candidatus Dojkabacteria bacterium]|uniref:phenylalanine--tRNA ligase n=1 Tax=Candidatus Dojkabacteria bacterium TaxID=2099670 RepID=A0A3M0Z0B3_9BACT|nr:MAG: hypothetical protein D6810_00855 [Candidatus Dojkabacteria bacterium]
MLLLFSQLKKYVPGLEKSVKEVCDAFTLTGQMLDKIHQVKYEGKDDVLLDLEVRQNRSDLLSTIGLAREIACYMDLEIKLPKEYEFPRKSYSENILPIEVLCPDKVKKIKAIKFEGVEIKKSPRWLSDYLGLFGINSINNLVDLTNYVMLETGIPSHVFDADLVGDHLVWELSHGKYKKMVTLNGQQIEIPNDALVISDGRRPLSMSFIGGKEDALNERSRNVILEFGIYDQATVRRNSRQVKVVTEASTRLEKFLDTRLVDNALSMLVEMIQELCGGSIVAEYEYCNDNLVCKNLSVRFDLISQLAGVQISEDFSLHILNKLGFEPTSKDGSIHVKQALGRTDISCEYDLVEEVIRFYGYDKIPTNRLSINIVKDITLSRIKLMDKVTDLLVSKGYDETRSWVLVDEHKNLITSFYPQFDPIRVTNSINEEVPILRSSIAVNLVESYKKQFFNGIYDASIFEIGKIFYRDANKMIKEEYFLGLLVRSLASLQVDFDRVTSLLYSIVAYLGFSTHNFSLKKVKEKVIEIAHPNSYLEFFYKEELVGRIFVTSKYKYEPGEVVIMELNLTKLDKIVSTDSTAEELSDRVIYRDVNLECVDEFDLLKNINTFFENNDAGNVFDWHVIDRYKLSDKIKYTIRIGFIKIGEKEADTLVEKLLCSKH